MSVLSTSINILNMDKKEILNLRTEDVDQRDSTFDFLFKVITIGDPG